MGRAKSLDFDPCPLFDVVLCAWPRSFSEADFFAELGFKLEEEDGLCFCLEGHARQLAHEVPPVSSERVSVTFRWFRADFLKELEHMEARLQ